MIVINKYDNKANATTAIFIFQPHLSSHEPSPFAEDPQIKLGSFPVIGFHHGPNA